MLVAVPSHGETAALMVEAWLVIVAPHLRNETLALVTGHGRSAALAIEERWLWGAHQVHWHRLIPRRGHHELVELGLERTLRGVVPA